METGDNFQVFHMTVGIMWGNYVYQKEILGYILHFVQNPGNREKQAVLFLRFFPVFTSMKGKSVL